MSQLALYDIERDAFPCHLSVGVKRGAAGAERNAADLACVRCVEVQSSPAS